MRYIKLKIILLLILFFISNITHSQKVIENVDVIIEFSSEQTTDGCKIDSNYVNIYLRIPYSQKKFFFELNNADMSNIDKTLKLYDNLKTKKFKKFDDTISYLLKYNITTTFIKPSGELNFEILNRLNILLTDFSVFDVFRHSTIYNINGGEHQNILLFEMFPTNIISLAEPFELITVIPDKKSKKNSLILKSKSMKSDYLRNKKFGIAR